MTRHRLPVLCALALSFGGHGLSAQPAPPAAAAPPAQPDVPLEDVGNAQMGTMLNGFLAAGDLYGAAPVLIEFQKRIESGELPASNMDKICFLIGMGWMQGYSKTNNKDLLKQAAEQFAIYIKKYPSGADIHYVLLNKVDCHRGNGEFKEAIDTLELLLNPRKPYLRKLRSKEKVETLEKMVQALTFEKDWDRGIPYFEQFLKVARLPEKKTMAAAALTEAYVAKSQFDKIDKMLPHLNSNNKYRFDPRLNFQFLQAGDHLASIENFEKASLFYSLTMAPKEIVASYDGLMQDLKPRLAALKKKKKKYKDNFPKNDEKLLGNLQFEWETLERKQKRVAEMLKKPETDYSKDLRWRKAQNYLAMSRDWEAFWGFMGLMTDYPDVDQETMENYIYVAMVCAEKIGKLGIAKEIAERYLSNEKYQKYAYEVGLRLANMYRDKAQELKVKADTAQTPPEAESFRKESNRNFDEMWELCTLLLDKKPKDKLANNVVFMMGSGWIARGEHDESKWHELIDTFDKLAAKDYGAEKPDMLNGVHYWAGLALLYLQEYERGHKHLDAVVKGFPESDYFEDAMFRRGVCAKGMEDYDTALSNFNEFQGKYPKSKMVVEAEVFKGDMASAQEKEEVATEHYKKVVFDLDYTVLPKDFKFIDYAVYEAMALAEKPETKEGWGEAKQILERYIEAHPDADHSKAKIEITRLGELMGDISGSIAVMFKTIIEQGNDRQSLAVDEMMVKYNEKYQEYFNRYTDTVKFLTKLKDDKAWRDKNLSDRNNLFQVLGNFANMEDEVKDKFTLDAEHRQKVIDDPSTLDSPLATYQELLGKMPQKPPLETFTDLLREAQSDGRDTLKYRLMMFLDNIYREQGSSLKQKGTVDLPQFFDVPDFQRASPGSLLWMAKYNIENGNPLAMQKAKMALASILKTFPGTEDAELPALLLLSELETKNAKIAPTPDKKELYYSLALKYYGIAMDRYPASGEASMGMANTYMVVEDYTKAILIFREVAGYSSWKKLHAEAYVRIGQCYYNMGKFDLASSFFQKTYVSFLRYYDWAAQGYLWHARTLKKLGKAADARAVLQEAIKNPKIRETPAFPELNSEL